MKLTEDPHRRLNALTNEWVLVSPHRTMRPWQGEVASLPGAPEPAYDPNCYLCPGNARVGGVRNPAYASTFVFDNDFAALKPNTARDRLDIDGMGLLVAEAEPGTCRVICFSPRHDLTLATMGVDGIELVVNTWVEQFRELGNLENISHVQIFENRGAMMGASNPHPHCQIWATASIPEAPKKELIAQHAYKKAHGRCLLCDYVALEEKQRCAADVFQRRLRCARALLGGMAVRDSSMQPTPHREYDAVHYGRGPLSGRDAAAGHFCIR